MLIDLHVHTTRGSSDSNLTIPRLVQEAKRRGLRGVCLTEHTWPWARHEGEELTRYQDILLIRGLEIPTNQGHVVAFGLEGYVSGIHQAKELWRVAQEAGAFLIAVHPFRGFFDSWLPNHKPITVEEASRLPIFSMVHAIEVANGGCTEEENAFALSVTTHLGVKATGGSDAHSDAGLGCYATFFERGISTEIEFLEELRAGRFYPVSGLLQGNAQPFAAEKI